MKPLLSVKITRENKGYKDWVPASDHNTAEGAAAFAARIERVRMLMQGNKPITKVRQIGGRK